MQVNVLGPVEVLDGGRAIPVAGTRVRRLIARLAVDAPRSVSMAELVEAVWYDGRPQATTNALQALVSRVRRTLERPEAIQQTPTGYRLVDCETDLDLFERLAARGRLLLLRGDLDGAAHRLGEAAAIWSGPALVDAGDAEYAVGLAARLQERRLEVIGDRIDADLGRGEAAQVVAELEELTAALPLRERFAGQLMRALAATGRPAEALAVFARLREVLADGLGADPSQELQEIHLDLLRGGTESGGAGARAGAADRPVQLPLRAALTTFVGRADELKRVHELLDGGRLVTIVGPGGTGKTRLAGEAAGSWPEPRRWHGHWLVELAPLSDPDLLPATVLTALGVREGRHTEDLTERPVSRDTMTRLLAALEDLQCLLVVDNCEHLLDGVAALVDRVLRECAGVRILATSREPIGIDGEAICVVPPLALPPADAMPDEAMRFPAVQLFADRAFAVRGDFAVDVATVSDVVEIVRRLDGLPLAIELAAARLRVLPVDEVAIRLTDRFRLLSGGVRAAVPRHRTLRAVVEWSWDLLSTAERALLERLAVFPTGVTVEAAEQVCAGPASEVVDVRDVPELLSALVDKSLVYVVDGHPLRYRMLETIREYGLERLAERGEIESTRSRFAGFFQRLAAGAAGRLHTSDQMDAFAIIEREQENIVAALRFLGDSGDAANAVALSLDLSWYLVLRNEHEEAYRQLSFVTAIPGADQLDLWPIADAGRILNRLAVEQHIGDADEMSDQLAEAARRLHEMPPVAARFGPVRALLQAGLALMSRDDELIAVTLDETLRSADPWIRGAAKALRAAIAENRGEIEVMRADAGSAVEAFRELGDRWGLATALTSQAYVRQMDGDLAGAVADCVEAAALMEELGAGGDSGFILIRLAGLLVRQGSFDEARELVEGVIEAAPSRDDDLILFAWAALAQIHWLQGDLVRARTVRDSCRRLLDGGRRRGPVAGHGRAVAEATVAAVDIQDGETGSAATALAAAYPVALLTQDGPVISYVGSVVAALSERLGEPGMAAEMLGACAVLRGGDDASDPIVKRLTELLREQLGEPGFERDYRLGREASAEAARVLVDPGRLGQARRR